MSKRNRNKNKARAAETVPAENQPKAENEVKMTSEDEQLQEHMKKDFKHLGMIIVFIVALLVALDIYNKQSHILDQMTDKLFGLF